MVKYGTHKYGTIVKYGTSLFSSGFLLTSKYGNVCYISQWILDYESIESSKDSMMCGMENPKWSIQPHFPHRHCAYNTQ